MTLEILGEQEYQDYLDTLESYSTFQTTQMAALLQKRGNETTYLGLRVEGELVVAGLVFTQPMTGGQHMDLYFGPNVKDYAYLQDFYQQLRDYAKANGVLELVVDPYESYQEFDTNGNPISEPDEKQIKALTDLGFQYDGFKTGYTDGRWHYVKDLSGLTADTLHKSFSKKGRPLVKKALSFGIKVRPLTRDELPLFKDITSSTSDRRNYDDKPLSYYEYFYDSFGDQAEFIVATLNFKDYLEHLSADQDKLAKKIEKLQKDLEKNPNSEKKNNQIREFTSQFDTFTVRKEEAQTFIDKYGDEDVILSGSLFVYTPVEAIYLFSGSYTEFNKFYAPAVLQDYVMKEAIKRNIPFYNFFGIQGVFDGSDSVLRFKQNFNGYIIHRPGLFRYYPNPTKYKVISTIKKVLRR